MLMSVDGCPVRDDVGVVVQNMAGTLRDKRGDDDF